MAMARTDNDSWDITESVGSTALGVAAARAAETESENPLIQDPFARAFLEAAGDGMWSLMANPSKAAELTDDADLLAHLQVMIDFNNDISEYWQALDVGQCSLHDAGLAVELGVNYAVYAMTH